MLTPTKGCLQMGQGGFCAFAVQGALGAAAVGLREASEGVVDAVGDDDAVVVVVDRPGVESEGGLLPSWPVVSAAAVLLEFPPLVLPEGEAFGQKTCWMVHLFFSWGWLLSVWLGLSLRGLWAVWGQGLYSVRPVMLPWMHAGPSERFGSDLPAVGSMLVAVACFGLVPAVIAVGRERNPFLFASAMRLGIAVFCLLVLAVFFSRSLGMLLRREGLVFLRRRFLSREMGGILFSYFGFVVFALSLRWAAPSASAVIYEVWPILLICIVAR